MITNRLLKNLLMGVPRPNNLRLSSFLHTKKILEFVVHKSIELTLAIQIVHSRRYTIKWFFLFHTHLI
jgi:hypothetical protein